MKTTLFTTHTLVFLVGLVIASSYFIFYGMPQAAKYIVAEPMFIKMTEDAEKESYNVVLQEDYIGNIYLKHPAYFFKREEGKQILADLAKRGYTPAAGSLFAYHSIKHMYADNAEDEQKHLMDAHRWAMLAAEQGDFMDLHILFHIHDLYEYQDDVSKELALLEKAAMESDSHIFATDLSVYYELQEGNKEKAEKWLKIAEETYKAPYQEPACTTIMPRKVSYTIPKP